jgi:hypothetical protein
MGKIMRSSTIIHGTVESTRKASIRNGLENDPSISSGIQSCVTSCSSDTRSYLTCREALQSLNCSFY